MQHCLIIIPGLGDNAALTETATKGFEKNNISIFIHKAPWNDIKESFDKKLDRLVNLIDNYHSKGFLVSILGISAGASLVLNAYTIRKDKINKVICVCGRLRTGNDLAHWFYPWSKRSPAFYKSVINSEKNQRLFTNKDSRQFLVFNAIYDDLVPLKTSFLERAENIRVPMVGHLFSIFYVMLFQKIK